VGKRFFPLFFHAFHDLTYDSLVEKTSFARNGSPDREKTMFFASLFFLGLSVCIFACLICFALARSVKRAPSNMPFPSEKAAWNQIKIAIADLYSRFDHEETPKQKSLRSWAGTLIICAGLCMIGILLEVQYNQPITIEYVASCYVGEKDLAGKPPICDSTLPPAAHPNKTAHAVKPKK
jgi:hypothetical protein